jgi:hypothetical protein
MRRIALGVLCLAAAGCGGETDVGDSACTAVLVWNDVAYDGVALDPPYPQPGAPLGDGTEPGCNDGGGDEPASSVPLREVEGVPPEVAVVIDGVPDALYTNPDYYVFLPLPEGPGRRRRGAQCEFAGEVVGIDALRVHARRREWRVTVDEATRTTGFDRGTLAYLRLGDRVQVRGRRCGGDAMIADRIALEP